MYQGYVNAAQEALPQVVVVDRFHVARAYRPPIAPPEPWRDI
jgi:hypothetical protein